MKKKIYIFKFFNFFTTIVTIIFIIILSEFFCQKILHLGKPIIYEPNILWGYSPKPMQNTKRFKQSHITIDSVGTRSIYKWNKDTEKIVFFGDSVTYGGSYIDDSEIFSNLTCKNKKNFSCFNAGVNAYGILNMTARSRFDERIQDSSIRIFVFITGDFFRGLQDKNTAHFFMTDLNKLLPGLHEITNFFFTKYNPKDFINKKLTKYEISDSDKKKAILLGLEELSKEYERLKKNKVKVYFYLSPNNKEFKANEINNLSKYVLQNGRNFGLDINSFLPEMLLSNMSEEKIFYDGVHFNKVGHKIISEKIIKDIF